MARSKSKSFFGLVLLTSLVIILAIVIGVTKSDKPLFSNSKAYVPEPCKICQSGKCQKVASYPACYSAYNECSCADGATCSTCGGSGGGGGGGAGYYCVNKSTHQCSYVTSGAQYSTYTGCVDSCRESTSSSCTNGTYKCTSDGTGVKRCANGVWGTATSCPRCNIIDSTSTSFCCNCAASPTPGTQCTGTEQKCSNDGLRHRRCQNGTWFDTACPRGCTQEAGVIICRQ